MKFLFLLSLIFLSSCQKDEFSVIGRYYPNEYRPELNLSQSSIISVSSNSVTSGNQIQVSLSSVDSNNQAVNYGGGQVSFFVDNVNSGTFSSTVDDNSGVYTSVFSAKAVGTFLIKARVNYGKKVVTVIGPQITIAQGSLSVANSTINLSKTLIHVGETLTFTLTMKDVGGNLYDDSSLFINPSLLDGTSTGTFSGVTYIGNAQYQGTFTASGSGSATHINLSVRYQGSVYSTQTVEVVP